MAPNYMQFRCGLTRIETAFRKQTHTPEQVDRFHSAIAAAINAYRAKQYVEAKWQYALTESLATGPHITAVTTLEK